MDIPEFFLQRHAQLHGQFIPGLRQSLTDEQFRQRPVKGVQPILWYIWHMGRVEDMGLSRFIWKRPQLLDESWNRRMKSQLSHYGTSMTEAQVSTFASTASVDGVLDYFEAVGRQTRNEITRIDLESLDEVLEEEEVNRIVRDEGMASEDAQWVSPHYIGRKRGWMLCHFGLTHHFRHFGQIALVKKLILQEPGP